MLKMNNKQCFLLFILLTVLLITGCEEEGDEDVIIGRWTTSSFAEYKNMNCTGSQLESPFFDMFNYAETYEIRNDGFTWTQSTSLNEAPYTEEGTYTISTTDSSEVYILLGTSSRHGIEGYREGFIGNEDANSMSIKVQWDIDNNHIIETCFNFTFDKVN